MTVGKVIAKIIWLTFLAHPVYVWVRNRVRDRVRNRVMVRVRIFSPI